MGTFEKLYRGGWVKRTAYGNKFPQVGGSSQLTASGKFHVHWPTALVGLKNTCRNRFGTACTELHCTSE